MVCDDVIVAVADGTTDDLDDVNNVVEAIDVLDDVVVVDATDDVNNFVEAMDALDDVIVVVDDKIDDLDNVDNVVEAIDTLDDIIDVVDITVALDDINDVDDDIIEAAVPLLQMVAEFWFDNNVFAIVSHSVRHQVVVYKIHVTMHTYTHK